MPIPWEKDAPAYGFNATGKAWVDQPAKFAEMAVDQQLGDPDSTLELYRSLLRARKERGTATGNATFIELGPEIVAVDVTGPDGTTRVVMNLGATPWPIPSGIRLLVTSEPGIATEVGSDQAVWLAV